MGLKIIEVDAFTDTPFAGNPAAVCVMPAPADERWMQAVAQEMNLSETAFLYPQTDGFNLRWFTPTSRSTSAATPRWRARTSCGKPGN